MIKEAIIKLSNKQDIGYNMAKEVMNEIMSGKASDIQKSAYLTANYRQISHCKNVKTGKGNQIPLPDFCKLLSDTESCND